MFHLDSLCPCAHATIGNMKRKQHFLSAVQILAPGDSFTLAAAQRVPEESLPVYPGGAALEPVVSLQKLRVPPSGYSSVQQQQSKLPLDYALRVQSANYWLALGEVEQALLELGALPDSASDHPSAVKARVAIVRAIRKRNEVTVQE
jgi:hypothetical protein